MRILVSEVQRENGETEHTYGSLPHESATGDTEDLVSVAKIKEVKCGGSSSARSRKQEVRRTRPDSTKASRPGERSKQQPEISRGPNRRQRAGTGSNEPRKHQNCAAPGEHTNRLPARQVTTNTAGNAQETSRTTFRVRISRSMMRADAAVAAQHVDRSHPPTNILTASPSAVMSARPNLKELQRVTSSVRGHGSPDMLSASPANLYHGVPVEPNDLLNSRQPSNTFRQPGMTRRQSNVFVFDAVAPDLRESLSTLDKNAMINAAVPPSSGISDLKSGKFRAPASPYQLTELQAQLLAQLPPQERAKIQAQRVQYAEELAKKPPKMRAALHAQFVAEMQTHMEAQLNSVSMDDEDFGDGLDESNSTGP